MSDPRTLNIPDFCLVVLMGASGSGKSTFADRHFLPTEVISSDVCRGLVADDPNDQGATKDAFDLVHYIAGKRLIGRRLAVIDATNVRREDRRAYIETARKHHALPVAIVLDPGPEVCHARNEARPDRDFGIHVVRRHTRELRRGLKSLQREGFRIVHRLQSEAEIARVEICRQPLWTDKRREAGGFDIIGDVHGCCDELEALLGNLGYEVSWDEDRVCRVAPPAGRRAVFVGDLVDRGPRTPDCLRLVMSMLAAGDGFCVLGNHDRKLARWLAGRNVKVAHGLQASIDQLEAEPEDFRVEVRRFLEGLLSHCWLDEGRLVVAHAGIKDDMIGRASGPIREFCLYGETTGEIDEFGFPVRLDWAANYRGDTAVVYGHTPVPEAEWLNNTICLDTGCVFGGKLTALRWPERELASVPARETYFAPLKPLAPEADGLTAQQQHDDLLDLADVTGKRLIHTELRRTVTVREENAAAALEVMSRFAVNPKWLVYLPPTMSPSETSDAEGWLERPEEAFAHFRARGVAEVVCEEKHMGSRAVIALARDAAAARRRFGVEGSEVGAVWTRTGRPFFSDVALTAGLLERVRAAAEGLFERLESDWLLLDAEIMPWSAKAQALIDQQYAPVAAAGRIGLAAAREALSEAAARGLPLTDELARVESRAARLAAYAEAWRPYCWPVAGLDDLRVAPFHLLASEGAVHMDRDHVWHMENLTELAVAGAPTVLATPWRRVALADHSAVAEATAWWEALTAKGGEGFVVKPLDFIARGDKGLVQPALKVRGKDYLRIIYGPEYDAPENLARLRRRGLAAKRSLALREFALGHEALTRFVAGQPLRRVHECVFAVLALESEPVDPRL